MKTFFFLNFGYNLIILCLFKTIFLLVITAIYYTHAQMQFS